MVLARIDDSLYVAAVKTAEGQLKQAEAAVAVNKANVLQQKANLFLATQNWERAQKLGPSDALAQSAYDQYRDTYEVAKANLASAEAAVEQAIATVAQETAALLTAQINLELLYDQIPREGRRHRQAGQYRTDGRFLALRPKPLPHCKRPDAHPGVDQRQ